MNDFAGKTYYYHHVFNHAVTVDVLMIHLILGAFENLKKSKFYDAESPVADNNEEFTSVPVKVATTYKAGSIMVNQRQVNFHTFINTKLFLKNELYIFFFREGIPY